MVQSQMNCLISSDSSAASVTDTCALSLRCGNSIDFLSNTLPGITAGDWIKQRSPGYRASRVVRLSAFLMMRRVWERKLEGGRGGEGGRVRWVAGPLKKKSKRHES